ncbi:MAG: hypothetical protein K0V04_27230 [Deltaproteobacteria bacterium]|nr:hypothetical protein [Deltaproteobacteria bacterium]
MSAYAESPRFFDRVPRAAWDFWASKLVPTPGCSDPATVRDIKVTPTAARPPFVDDPIVAKIVDESYEQRHSGYYRTIASWPQFSLQPISQERAQALSAWCVSAFLIDDLVDGWESKVSDLDLAGILASQETLVEAIDHRESTEAEPPNHGSSQFNDAVLIARRAAALAYLHRPSDTWWRDYRREVSTFIYGRAINTYLSKKRVLLPVEYFLRARAMDLGGSMITVMSGLAAGSYPMSEPGLASHLATLQALTWLHLTATNDLYSYFRERGETQFNLLCNIVENNAQLERIRLADAVDCVVRFANSVWDDFHLLAQSLIDRSCDPSTMTHHVEQLRANMVGNVQYVQSNPFRYSAPGVSDPPEVRNNLPGRVPWGSEHWDDVEQLLGNVAPLCRDCWEFALPPR